MEAPMLSKDEEMADRIDTMRNDLDVKRQQQQKTEGTTMQAFAQAQADEINQGRFAATGVPNVIGAKPEVAQMYPPASAAHQVDLPPEPALGYAIDQMPTDEPSAGVSILAEDTGAPAGATSSLDNLPPAQDEVSDTGAPSSIKE
jgi:hypothetical protein